MTGSADEGQAFRYYEATTAPPAGVTEGWCVVHNGKAGPALVARAVVMTDPEGHQVFEVVGDFEPVTVVDDSTPDPPG